MLSQSLKVMGGLWYERVCYQTTLGLNEQYAEAYPLQQAQNSADFLLGLHSPPSGRGHMTHSRGSMPSRSISKAAVEA